jgi:hypothetical protein
MHLVGEKPKSANAMPLGSLEQIISLANVESPSGRAQSTQHGLRPMCVGAPRS